MGPKVDAELCEGCGTCVDVCPADVFEMMAGKASAAKPDECLDCGACTEECPTNAIVMED